MPLIRIDLLEGRSDTDVAAIASAVHRALGETLDVPERDRFQVITEHRRGRMLYNPAYLGVERSEAVVFIQVVLSAGRSAEKKQAFYSRTASLVADTAHMRREDVVIVLVENERIDWSFGNGEAQYATMPKEQWK